MSNCAVCHKPVKSGVVVHSECMELLHKTQQLDNKPLTFGEVLDMDGEPVWIERGRGYWALVDADHKVITISRGDCIEISSIIGAIYRRKPNDWISVKDRLPDEELKQFKIKYPKEKTVEVIVVITGASESTTLYWNGHYFEDLDGEPYSVSHWMPLPAPPEVE